MLQPGALGVNTALLFLTQWQMISEESQNDFFQEADAKLWWHGLHRVCLQNTQIVADAVLSVHSPLEHPSSL